MNGIFVKLADGKPSHDYACKSCGYRVKYFPYSFPHRESTNSFKMRFWVSHPLLLSMWSFRAFKFETKHLPTDVNRLIMHHHLPRRYGILLPSLPTFSFPSLILRINSDYLINYVAGYGTSIASKLLSIQTNGYIPFMVFSPDKLRDSKETNRCYCGTIVKGSKFVYDNLVFCSQKHLDNFKEARVDPLCGLILPSDPLQGISAKHNITMDRGMILDKKKYVFCSTEHRDLFARRNGLPLNLPEPDPNRRSFVKMAGALGAGLVGAFTLGRISVPTSAQQSSNNGADPAFGANGVGLPSLTSDPTPLPPNGYLWYRSDLNVVRISSDGLAFSLGVRPFISISPSGPDMHGDYGPNTPGTTTAGFQEAMNFLATQGIGPYGGILEIFPGGYSSSSTWTVPLPNNSSSSVLDITFQVS